MKYLILGLALTCFGLFIGGAGLASAGIGISIPMIPLGLYFTYRGWRIYQYEKSTSDQEVDEQLEFEQLEDTSLGKIFIGTLLTLVGIGTSSSMIGVLIILAGIYFLYIGLKKPVEKFLHIAGNPVDVSEEESNN